MFKETQHNSLKQDCTQTFDVSEVKIYNIHVNLQIESRTRIENILLLCDS